MLVIPYSEARQNFATVLDKSQSHGAVLVKHSDIIQALRKSREEK